MKKQIVLITFLIFTISFSALQSCCNKSSEAGRFELNGYEKSFIPYEKGQNVTFFYSGNSQTFLCDVLSVELFEARTVTEHCNENYYVYENKVAELSSKIPQLYISLKVTPVDFNPFMLIKINNTYFNVDITKEPDIDTVYIQDNPFTEVYKIEADVDNDNVIVPNRILFNKAYGILQIKLTNDETYDIKLQ